MGSLSEVLIVGFGNQGRRRAEALHALGAKISVYDPGKERDEVPFPLLREWPEKVEAAVIATPPTEHLSMAALALGSGARRILIEKPLTWEPDGRVGLYEELLHADGCEIRVAAPWIQAPCFIALGGYRTEGILQLNSVTLCNVSAWPPATYREGERWFLYDVGAHLLYLGEYLLGDPFSALEVDLLSPPRRFFTWEAYCGEEVRYSAIVDGDAATDDQTWTLHLSGFHVTLRISTPEVGNRGVKRETAAWWRGGTVGISLADAWRHCRFLEEACFENRGVHHGSSGI